MPVRQVGAAPGVVPPGQQPITVQQPPRRPRRGGLLAPDQAPMGGLLGEQGDDVPRYGLLGLASGLLEAGAPSVGQPRSPGALGLQGAMQGMQMDAQARRAAMEEQLMRSQIEQAGRPRFQTVDLPGLGTVQIDARTGQMEVLRPSPSPTFDTQTGEWRYPPGSAPQGGTGATGQPGQRAPGMGLYPSVASSANELRDEFNSRVAFFGDVAGALQRVRASAALGTGPGDMGLIIGTMKLLDPGSVVREGEFATVRNTGSMPERLQAALAQALSGELLTPEIRAELLQMAEAQFPSYADRYRGAYDEYSRLAQRYNIDPSLVVRELSSAVDLAQPMELPPAGIRLDEGASVAPSDLDVPPAPPPQDGLLAPDMPVEAGAGLLDMPARAPTEAPATGPGAPTITTPQAATTLTVDQVNQWSPDQVLLEANALRQMPDIASALPPDVQRRILERAREVRQR